jgi:predicted PurR-regulated permease PerM
MPDREAIGFSYVHHGLGTSSYPAGNVSCASVLVTNEEHIGDMALRMITGLKNTGLSGFLPSFSEAQLSNFDETLKDLMVKAIITLTGNIMQTLLSIIIFFLSLSMLLYYGEYIWNTMTCNLSPKLSGAVDRLSEISANTVYAHCH